MSEWQHLNRQLRELSDLASNKIPVFGALNLNQDGLASGLAHDLSKVLRYADLEWPSIIEELDVPVSLPERHDALLGYYALTQIGNFKDPVLQRSRVIMQLYFDLIYFRDRILIALRNVILKEPGKFGLLEYLSEWLELVGDNPLARKLKALRNGFAHGKWAYLPGYSGLVFYPEQQAPYSRYEVTQEELNLIHGLLYSFQLVFFTIVNEEILKRRVHP